MNNALKADFKRKSREQTTDPLELAYLEYLFEEDSRLSTIPAGFLWKALNFPLRWVQVHALYEIFRRRDEQGIDITLKAGDSVLLVGQLAWSAEDIGPALLSQGITLKEALSVAPGDSSGSSGSGVSDAPSDSSDPGVSDAPGDPSNPGVSDAPGDPSNPGDPSGSYEESLIGNVDAIVLGPSPGTLPSTLSENILLLKEEEIAAVALDSDEFYLSGPDRAIEHGNLKTLLLSKDRNSIELAMQIMAKGGMPTSLITVLFALKRSQMPYALRQEAGKFLLRYSTGVFKRNLLRNYFDFLGGDKQLVKSDLKTQDPEGFIDLDQYLRLNFKFSPGNQFNGENLVTLHKGLKGIPDDLALGILQDMESERRLRIPKTVLEFPAVAYRMEHLKSIEIYHAQIGHLPEGISKLPSLIRIWFNCGLESLPSDIGHSPSIRMVNLFNCKFPEFPIALAHLIRLKILRWENCLADPEQELILPNALFERDLNTAILIEKNIRFPDKFFESKSLKSLAISHHSTKDYLHKIGKIASLQRIRIQYEEGESTDLLKIRKALPEWRQEDQTERNYSFVRR